MVNNILYSINDIVKLKHEHHLYEIHPTNNETISGYIETFNDNIIDWETKTLYTDKDIWDIDNFEEQNPTFYKQII